MYTIIEHDTSRIKDDQEVAIFFNKDKAWAYAKEHQSHFAKESSIVVGVKEC